MAAAKPLAAELAGRVGDALVNVDPDPEIVKAYREAGGDGPRYGQVRLCWAEDEDEAKQTVFELWRHSGLEGTLNQELPRPSDFDAVAESVTLEMATEGVPCGPDPEPVLALVPGVGGGRLRPDLLPPGRLRPGGLLPLLGGRVCGRSSAEGRPRRRATAGVR